MRARQIGGTAEDILDLSEDVDPDRDHIRGPDDAPVTLVEYGDFECPYCGQAESVVRELLASFGDDLRYVWRHLPLNDVHATRSSPPRRPEAAAAQGKFWEMYDALLAHQDALTPRTSGATRRSSASTSSASGTSCAVTSTRREWPRTSPAPTRAASRARPTFFINGRRHQGAYDIDTLTAAVRSAPLPPAGGGPPLPGSRGGCSPKACTWTRLPFPGGGL